VAVTSHSQRLYISLSDVCAGWVSHLLSWDGVEKYSFHASCKGQPQSLILLHEF